MQEKDTVTNQTPPKAFPLQNVPEPVLYRDVFPYVELPKLQFEHTDVPLNPAKEIWITDTTFRDGQQARPPYTVRQIVDLYTLMHRLDGGSGLIRNCEFFLYSKRDREAIEKCRELGFEFPLVTGWIRAVKSDFKLVKGRKVAQIILEVPIEQANVALAALMTYRDLLTKALLAWRR
ncbi:hypothetical protein LCGC14_2927740, partial [marine sediment metagenome]